MEPNKNIAIVLDKADYMAALYEGAQSTDVALAQHSVLELIEVCNLMGDKNYIVFNKKQVGGLISHERFACASIVDAKNLAMALNNS